MPEYSPVFSILLFLVGAAIGYTIYRIGQRPTAERRIAVLAVIELSPEGITFDKLQNRLYLNPRTLQSTLDILVDKTGVVYLDDNSRYHVRHY